MAVDGKTVGFWKAGYTLRPVRWVCASADGDGGEECGGGLHERFHDR